MQLRVEPAYPFALFPAAQPTASFFNNASAAQSLFPPLPNPFLHNQHPSTSQVGSRFAPSTAANVKRTSAFEPVLSRHNPHQQHQHQHYTTTTSTGTTSATNTMSNLGAGATTTATATATAVTPPPPALSPASPADSRSAALVIPPLADCAASIAYLMWHGRKKSLYGDKARRRESLIDVSKPNPAFKKFCLQLLTATQLTQHAVYLALKYFADLLRDNPTVEGDEGTEYRLFTVSLILANKFLDDSTFTNKTWSDVSGIPVVALNAMEVEFLTALGYRLHVSGAEYEGWRQRLTCARKELDALYVGHPHFEIAVRRILATLNIVTPQLNSATTTTTTTTTACATASPMEDPLARQREAIWEAEAEAYQLQRENRERQYYLDMYTKAHGCFDNVNVLPRRQTVPPPPISRRPSSEYQQLPPMPVPVPQQQPQQHHHQHYQHSQPSSSSYHGELMTPPPGLQKPAYEDLNVDFNYNPRRSTMPPEYLHPPVEHNTGSRFDRSWLHGDQYYQTAAHPTAMQKTWRPTTEQYPATPTFTPSWCREFF
ncbi:cyclin-domain-containing protein [Syncephalastrum racemosum]|uniref:Cyclin-domain-containing protein n=1 Tax=Syncephalastrum racemosum TaxID=13706 RepID=A0A1X2H593_SYNRA|nr:cyclin-domain-containing protein [Syncephalastrum racemosum]